jgi:transcriptional regulator with XRE-family HTH domain
MSKYIEQSRRLREIKDFLGYSEDKQFAEMLGVPQPTMSGYFSGARLSVDLVILLFGKCKISPLWFLCGQGAMIYTGESEPDFRQIYEWAILLPLTTPRSKETGIPLSLAKLAALNRSSKQ